MYFRIDFAYSTFAVVVVKNLKDATNIGVHCELNSVCNVSLIFKLSLGGSLRMTKNPLSL